MEQNVPTNSNVPQLPSVDLSEVSVRNGKLRTAYLEVCEQLGVQPCNELVAALNINPLNAKNKKKVILSPSLSALAFNHCTPQLMPHCRHSIGCDNASAISQTCRAFTCIRITVGR